MNRRKLLAAFGSTPLLSLPWLAASSTPSSGGDYRALVCIGLYGGNDGLNTVVPYDIDTYGTYAGVRKDLAIPRSALVPLNAQLALHPSLASLRGAWDDDALGVVLNVGPLAHPLTKAAYRDANSHQATIPDNLFSHSDQQMLWENSSHTTQEKTGWGGRAAATQGDSVVVSAGGNSIFGIAERRSSLVLPGPGERFGLQGDFSGPGQARGFALEEMLKAPTTHALHKAFASHQLEAIAAGTKLGPVIEIGPGNDEGLNAAFTPVIAYGGFTNPLAAQLYQIAKLIKYRSILPSETGVGKNIFFASLGGFDTHGNQIEGGSALHGTHATLLTYLGSSVAAFYAAMKQLGLQRNVTAFTQSDFGRTFAPNDSLGTDHAWGNNQLVIGGMARSTSVGRYPTLELGGPDDIGVDSWECQGRWIPTTSVDQYAAALLRWHGLSDAALSRVLPNLANFGPDPALRFS